MYNFISPVLQRGRRSCSSPLGTKHYTKPLERSNCVFILQVPWCRLAHTTFYPAVVAAENPGVQNPLRLCLWSGHSSDPAWLSLLSTAAPCQHTQGQKDRAALNSVSREWDGMGNLLSMGEFVMVFTDFCCDFWSVAKRWLIIDLSCVGCVGCSTESTAHCMCSYTTAWRWNGTK